jgi:hypothetical protein
VEILWRLRGNDADALLEIVVADESQHVRLGFFRSVKEKSTEHPNVKM